jgi:hypothetical protein
MITDSVIQHFITHLPRSIRCPRCPATFATTHGVILHLESGNCVSGNNILTVNLAAARCGFWRNFFDIDARSMAMNRQFIFHLDYYPFFCPGCGKGVTRLSALFNHVWSARNCTGNANVRRVMQELQTTLVVFLPYRA